MKYNGKIGMHKKNTKIDTLLNSKLIYLLLEWRFEVLLSLLIIVYIFILSHLSIMRLLSLNSHYYDLGIMDQVVYNTSKGRILEMTDPMSLKNTLRFAIHFDPLMIIFSPLYLFRTSPTILLIGQTIILAIGSIFVFLIARNILKSKLLALLFAFLYLTYYPLQFLNLFDFHAVAIATTSLLGAFYFLAIKGVNKKFNVIVGFILILISILTKENVALVCIFFGLYLLFIKKYKKLGLLIMLTSFTTFVVVVFKLIPAYRDGGSFALKYFDFSSPTNSLQMLLSSTSLNYLTTLLTPTAFLSFFSPIQLLIAIPDFAINLLSSNSNMRSVYFQYTSLITPFVFISSIYGFNNLNNFLKNKFNFNEKRLLAFTILVISLSTNYYNSWSNINSYKVDQKQLVEVRNWRKKLKNDQLTVSTTGSIAPFFTERQNFIDFLYDPSYESVGISQATIISEINKYEQADYVVIKKSDINVSDPIHLQYYNSLKNNSKFNLISDYEGIEVYKKISDYLRKSRFTKYSV